VTADATDDDDDTDDVELAPIEEEPPAAAATEEASQEDESAVPSKPAAAEELVSDAAAAAATGAFAKLSQAYQRTPEDEAIFGGFQDYDDESLWNFELGLKAQTSTVTFNAAVFTTDIDDLQVTLDAGSCSSRIVFNVPSASTVGFESELTWEPTDRLLLTLAGSYIEAEFDSTVRDGNGNVIGGIEDGNRLPTVPETQFSASGAYTFPLDLGNTPAEGFVTASVQHVGSRFTQPGDQVPGAGEFAHGLPFAGMTGNEVTTLDLELSSYQIAYFSAGIDFGRYVVTAFIDNVFDENALLSFDRERGGRARLGFRTNQPRTFGVNLRANF